MIQTIRDYEYLSKRDIEAGRISRIVGRKLDAYWNREENNWVLTFHKENQILIEFPRHRDIRPDLVIDAIRRRDHGGVKALREETNLSFVAADARKAKAQDDFKSERRHHLRDAGQYEDDGKRSYVVPGGD